MSFQQIKNGKGKGNGQADRKPEGNVKVDSKGNSELLKGNSEGNGNGQTDGQFMDHKLVQSNVTLDQVELFRLRAKDATTPGKLAGLCMEVEETHLDYIVIIGDAIRTYSESSKITVKKASEVISNGHEKLTRNTLEQWTGMSKLAATIGPRFFELGSWSRAQKIKGLLGKLNGKGEQLMAIERYNKGESLDKIRESFGLLKQKGDPNKDQDAVLELAAAKDPVFAAELEAELKEQTLARLTYDGMVKLADKMVQASNYKLFLDILLPKIKEREEKETLEKSKETPKGNAPDLEDGSMEQPEKASSPSQQPVNGVAGTTAIGELGHH